MLTIDFDIRPAFAPFFSDTIVVDGVRPFAGVSRRVSGTFKACVIDCGFSDAMSEADAESDVREFSVSLPAGEWIDRTRPQVGDRIRLADGRQLAVAHVNSLAGDTWSMTAREVC